MKLFCGALFVLVALASAAKLPSYVRVCNRNDPELNTCLKTTLQDAVLKFSKGVPELNFPVLEPAHIPETRIQYQQGDSVAKISIGNTKIYGGSKLRINDVRAELNDTNLYVEADVYFPRLFIEGNYKTEGKIALFVLNAKGVYNISMSDISATWKVTGESVIKEGETYMKIEHFRMRPRVGKMTVYASNLFPGNEELSRGAVTFANQFWKEIYNELLPFVEDPWDQLMSSMANQVFLKVPYKNLVPML